MLGSILFDMQKIMDFNEIFKLLEASDKKNKILIERMIEFMEQTPGRITNCYGNGFGGPCSPKCKRCTLLADLKEALHSI